MSELDKILKDSGLGDALVRKAFFDMEVPMFNLMQGKEPYQFRDIWGKKTVLDLPLKNG